jgi:periplasmic protein TonB
MNAPASPADFAPSRHDDEDAAYREPMSRPMRLGLLALVIFFHVGGAWALINIEPTKLEIGDVASMEVRLVPSEQPAQAQPEPPKPELQTPPPEDTPPPEPQLESMIQPPLPDLPPPEFPVKAPPPKPKPPPPKPKPAQVTPPTEAQPSQASAAPAATSSAPKTVSASQVAYLTPPSPIYPARSRRAGEKGTVTVKVLIDATGRPAQVALQGSSGFAALDESAVSAVRAARFRPYSEGGTPQAVWVLVPINFVLQ